MDKINLIRYISDKKKSHITKNEFIKNKKFKIHFAKKMVDQI